MPGSNCVDLIGAFVTKKPLWVDAQVPHRGSAAVSSAMRGIGLAGGGRHVGEPFRGLSGGG